ncbi:MAG: MSMEG_0567/Sll0786 family nitrogen starvation N-acetyltransferase [Candidatus Neomarinimicrobiota bacterium]|nr:MSMEG_0567/Sll0786 family nitrogen starvation N-acetyltransferase [Candidatus Neomarinimicrobiota bacterium]
MSKVICRIAETEAELQGCFAVRHAVFVEEQKIFFETDRDSFDQSGIHIAAIDTGTGKVVSTVRCHEVDEAIWYGTRLAVAKDYRSHPSHIGVSLCKLAEKTVADRGAKRFLAYVQPQNVRFFEGLRWRKVGKPVMHFELLHQLMQASLFDVRKNTENLQVETNQTVYA